MSETDPRLVNLDAAFESALAHLSTCRIAYEDDPRDPNRISALGAARASLEDCRSAMQAERERLGLEPKVTPRADEEIKKFDGDLIPQWKGKTGEL